MRRPAVARNCERRRAVAPRILRKGMCRPLAIVRTSATEPAPTVYRRVGDYVIRN